MSNRNRAGGVATNKLNLGIKNWQLDYRLPPYEDCTDGNFVSDRQFKRGDIVDCDFNGQKYKVVVVASIPLETQYKTFFDLK